MGINLTFKRAMSENESTLRAIEAARLDAFIAF